MPTGWKPVRTTYKPMVCDSCNEPFKPRQYNQTYCSPDCRTAGQSSKICYIRSISLRIYRLLEKDPGRLQGILEELKEESAQPTKVEARRAEEEEEARAFIQGRKNKAPDQADIQQLEHDVAAVLQ